MMQFGKLVIVEVNDNVAQIMQFYIFWILMFFSQHMYVVCVVSPLVNYYGGLYVCSFLGYARATSSKMVLGVPTGRGSVNQTLCGGKGFIVLDKMSHK